MGRINSEWMDKFESMVAAGQNPFELRGIGGTLFSICVGKNLLDRFVDYKHLVTDALLVEKMEPLVGPVGKHDCVIDRMAKKGSLSYASALLTDAFLEKRSKYCETSLLAIAAEYGVLNQVPVALLTEKNLLREPNTVLHLAALNGSLAQIPVEITRKHLMRENLAGETVLHFCAWSGNFKQVPDDMLTYENLTKPSMVSGFILGVKAAHLNFPLGYAVMTERMDGLLGFDFPDSARAIVGEDWWEKNERVKLQISELGSTEEDAQVDLF